MGQYFTKEEEELSIKIFTDQEYDEIVENTDLHDKMKMIILKHRPFTGSEIDDFVQKNLNRPVLEEIFNDFKGNEGIRNAMKKYGVTTIHPIMPHLIYLEFFTVNENLIEQKEHQGNMEQQWEEAEKILSWREMQPGVYRYHGIEHRGRPISVVTLEREGVKMYYAPSSLYWDLKNRLETNFLKYEGTQTSPKGYECLNLPNKGNFKKKTGGDFALEITNNHKKKIFFGQLKLNLK